MSAETITPVANRQWWPEHFLDEEMPKGRPTPDAWLFRLEDGTHQCGVKPGTDPYDDDFGYFAVAEGEVVAFNSLDDLGTAHITIAEGGGYSFDRELSARAVYFCAAAEGAWGDDQDELVRNLIETGLPVAGKTLPVDVEIWPDGRRLRFTALDGPPRFVPAAEVPAEGDGHVR